jgi:AcrR family transcriptional regulator
MSRVTRATPLPPDERRAALIAATEPLLEQFGRDVSTRQIAEAANVAEGTIFRAFPTKEALIDAVLKDVFDVQHTCDELAEIDLGQDVEARLVEAVRVLQARLKRVFALFHSMRLTPPMKHDQGDFRERQRTDNERLNSAIAALLEPDQASLRFQPVDAAVAVRTVTFALTHPIIGEDRFTEPEKIVNLVLHGILTGSTTGGRGC